MREHYPLVGQGLEYFIVDGHEWPTLLFSVAKWLYEKNVCVQGITFFEQIEGESYISATVQHDGTWTEQVQNPMGVLDQMFDAVDNLKTDMENAVIFYGEALSQLAEDNGL